MRVVPVVRFLLYLDNTEIFVSVQQKNLLKEGQILNISILFDIKRCERAKIFVECDIKSFFPFVVPK